MDEIQNSMKRILYDLLQDTEIQEVIKGIIKKDREQGWEYQQKIEALEKENKVLGHQLEEGQMECERLHKNCQKLEEENTVLKREKKEIQDSREEIFKQLQSKKKEFEPLEEINDLARYFEARKKSEIVFKKFMWFMGYKILYCVREG